MTNEISARLRAQANAGSGVYGVDCDLARTAADEIERLQAESDAWDKLSLVQLSQENQRLREEVRRLDGMSDRMFDHIQQIRARVRGQ